MSDKIDFEKGVDTGEADADAIVPYQNGENADASTLNRPVENLRNRTEVLRAEANLMRWVQRADRQMALWFSGSGSITWNGVGSNVTGSAGLYLVLAPFLAPGATDGPGATELQEEFSGTLYPSRRASLVVDNGGDSIVFLSNLFEYQGANNISVEIVDDPGSGGVVVDVTGDATVSDPSLQPGFDNIKVTYDSLLSHTLETIKNQVNAHPDASSLVTVEDRAGNPATASAVEVSETYLSGGLDSVLHRVVTTHFDLLTLDEGDTVAVWYDTASLRRQSINELTFDIPSASVINLSEEPEKAPHSVPIFRVLEGRVVFANGFVLGDGESISDFKLNTGADVVVDGSAWTEVVSASDVQTAFDNVDAAAATLRTDLSTLRDDVGRGAGSPPAPGDGAAFGAQYVGVDASAISTNLGPGLDNVQTALTQIDAIVGALDLDTDQLRNDIENGPGSPSPPAPGAGTSGADYIYTDPTSFTGLSTSTPKSLQDVLDEIDFRLAQNTVAHSSFQNQITSNFSEITSNDADIATNVTNISTNASDIASNDADIAELRTLAPVAVGRFETDGIAPGDLITNRGSTGFNLSGCSKVGNGHYSLTLDTGISPYAVVNIQIMQETALHPTQGGTDESKFLVAHAYHDGTGMGSTDIEVFTSDLSGDDRDPFGFSIAVWDVS